MLFGIILVKTGLCTKGIIGRGVLYSSDLSVAINTYHNYNFTAVIPVTYLNLEYTTAISLPTLLYSGGILIVNSKLLEVRAAGKILKKHGIVYGSIFSVSDNLRGNRVNCGKESAEYTADNEENEYVL